MEAITQAHPEIRLEHKTFKTTGDQILDRKLDEIGGKGLFVKELDIALRERKIDLAVHSLKDMPMETPEDLPILAYSKREDARDAMVFAQERGAQMVIGCSSARRTVQLQKMLPDAQIKSVRGNIHTRLAKLDAGEYSALVLASAGLKRMGLTERINIIFEPHEMIPAAGQGILSVQGRAGEDYAFLDCVNDLDAEVCARAERAFVAKLDGGCSAPIAAYARREGDLLYLTGMYVDGQGNTATGEDCADAAAPEALGVALARRLKEECK